MPNAEIANCGTCRFWQPGKRGSCHCNPPTPYVTEYGWEAVFPPISARGWCGQHEFGEEKS